MLSVVYSNIVNSVTACYRVCRLPAIRAEHFHAAFMDRKHNQVINSPPVHSCALLYPSTHLAQSVAAFRQQKGTQSNSLISLD